MRKLFSWIGLLVFGPLLLMLLFMMPLEFVASSWHLFRTRDGLTHGKVVSSEKVSHHGNSRSDIRYRYVVDGREYESDRVRAGWFSHAGYESGAGELGGALRPRDTLPVFYDPSDPAFALVEYGWPKWSIAFSMLVWGLILSNHSRPDPPDRLRLPAQLRSTSRQLLGYGVGTGAILLGFGLLIIRPSTVELQDVPWLLISWCITSLLAMGYGWFRHRRRPAR